MSVDYKTSKESNTDYLKIFFSIFILSILTLKVVNNLVLLIFALTGLILWFKKDLNPFKDRNLRILSFFSTTYFLVILGSIIMVHGFSIELSHIARKIHFLLVPLIAVTISYVKIELDEFLKLCKFALILSIIPKVIIFSIRLFGAPRLSDETFTGMFNANIYGDMVVVMMFISITKIYSENRKDLILTLLAFSIGLASLILSGSRGSFLSFIVLLILFLVLTYKKFFKSYINSRKNLIKVLVIFVGVITLFYPYIAEKYTTTVNSLNYWSTDKVAYSSSGIRLEMWNAALKAHEDAPWHGYGYRNANKVVSKYSDYHPSDISVFTHLHNEYLTNLLSAGYAGLISVLSMIVIPLYIFLKTRRCQEAYYYSLIGINLCVAYASFGITHISFGEENINALYVFLMSYLLPNALKQYKDK